MPERPLRVATVNHTARMGGGEVALLSIAEHLDRRTLEWLAVLGEEGALAERLRAMSLEVLIQPLDRSVLDRRKEALAVAGLVHPIVLTRAAQGMVQLALLFRRRRIEVVHTNTLKAHLLGGLAGRLAGARVVWHVRDHLSAPYLPAGAVALVRLAARVLPQRIVAVSTSAARTVGRGDVVVIRQGVALPAETAERPSDGRLRVGLVGRLAPWKGQHVFLDAAAQLAPAFPECEFVLAGAPLFGEQGYERELRAQASRNGIADRVRFLGFCDDVWQVYRELDVVVHASTLPEPYGNVVLEAMASRRPIVAAAAGGILELVVHGQTGLLVPPGDATALASALAPLLRSPAERRRLAHAGRRYVEQNFSPERDAAELQRVWGEAARRRRHVARSGARAARSAARRLGDRRRRGILARRWRPLLPPGKRAADLSPSIVGLDPARVDDLSRILGMTATEVVEKLCFRGAQVTLEIQGTPVAVRAGTADVFTVDDTFGAGYHRSLWELPPSPVIVDLGANIGLTVLDYGLTYPGATILGVELDEDNVRMARLNTACVPGAAIIHGGVAASEGLVRYGAADTNAYAVSPNGDRSAPAVTIAAVLEQLGGRHVDLLKMDIEGAEREVIADGAGWAPRVKHVLVETHLPYTREQCIHDLRQLGFSAQPDQRHPAGVAASRPAPSPLPAAAEQRPHDRQQAEAI